MKSYTIDIHNRGIIVGFSENPGKLFVWKNLKPQIFYGSDKESRIESAFVDEHGYVAATRTLNGKPAYIVFRPIRR